MAESGDGKIRKTVRFNEEGVTIDELLLSKVGKDLFKIEQSTVMVESASYGDIIQVEEFKNGDLLFLKVIEKSKFEAHFFVLSEEIVNSPFLEIFLGQVSQEGGYWERNFGGLLNIYLPESSELNPKTKIEEIGKNPTKS